MDIYFTTNFIDTPFQLFSPMHLVILMVLCILNLLIILLLKRMNSKKLNTSFCAFLAILIILLEASAHTWRIAAGKWILNTSLPLHLCGMSAYLSVIMLIKKKKQTLFEVIYMWGLGGAIMALLTPNLNYPFPHFMFLKFFITHSCIITAVLYLTFIENFRPVLKSIWKVFAITNIYMLLIAIVNLLIDSNYLYICHKPGNTTLLDHMGPWPFYILGIEFVGLIIFFLLYLPFAVKDLAEKRKRGVSI